MWKLKHRRLDGSFVIELGGYPYHVIKEDPLFESVSKEAKGKKLPKEEIPTIQYDTPKGVTTISMRQFRIALLRRNLLDDYEKKIYKSDKETQIEWEYSTRVSLDSKLSVVLNMTDEAKKDFFDFASKI
jgi:hypothetical protein